MTITTVRYATPADATIAAKQTLKRMLVRRTPDTEALLDVDPAAFTIGDRVDEAAIRAWVEANTVKPVRSRTYRTDGHPAGRAMRFQEPGEHAADEETTND